jgi:2-(1,2-epoxy-1,2-dihydrophenyl)acetyl-CoA isomerase
MGYTTLSFDVREQVAYIKLNRPEAANALDLPLARELQEAIQCCSQDSGIRAVVLTGTGRAFCGGGDLKTFLAEGSNMAAYVKAVTLSLHDAISGIARMNAPVIAAVNGVAAGGGLGLVCACDLVIAAASARFTMAYTRAGLTPDAASSYYLPRLVGLRRALELTLTNRMLSAEEAVEWGLVSSVVPDAELQPAAQELAGALAAGATRAQGGAKRLLQRAWTETLETQMAFERESIAAASCTTEALEGISAFLEKRSPRFGDG